MHAGEKGFELDQRLERESEPLIWLGLCELRVMNDSRWPWLLLVPQRKHAVEFHDLTPLDQTMLTFEISLVSDALKKATGCCKVNVAWLGNIVPQLHVHVIARNEGDIAWPGPVWGHAGPEPYRREELHSFVSTIRSAL